MRNLRRRSRQVKLKYRSYIKQTHGTEEDGEYREAHQLDGFPTPDINESERCIVAREQPSGREDHVADTNIVQVVVNTLRTFSHWRAETDGL